MGMEVLDTSGREGPLDGGYGYEYGREYLGRSAVGSVVDAPDLDAIINAAYTDALIEDGQRMVEDVHDQLDHMGG